MLNKKRQITKKREGKVALKLKTTNVYELTRDELYKYVTNREEGLVYKDENIMLFNLKPKYKSNSAIKIISTKHPNLYIDTLGNEFNVYDNGIRVDIFGDNSISSKYTLNGLLKRLDRLVVKLVNDKHFEETQNGIIYGSHRLYKYIDLKLSMMRSKKVIARFKSELATLDGQIENAKEYNRINTHKNLKCAYDSFLVEQFNRPIRTLKRTQKEYLSTIEKNEKEIAIIQDEINKLKITNYYASVNH